VVVAPMCAAAAGQVRRAMGSAKIDRQTTGSAATAEVLLRGTRSSDAGEPLRRDRYQAKPTAAAHAAVHDVVAVRSRVGPAARTIAAKYGEGLSSFA